MLFQVINTYNNDDLTELAFFLVAKQKNIKNSSPTYFKQRGNCVGNNKRYVRLNFVGVVLSGVHMGLLSIFPKCYWHNGCYSTARQQFVLVNEVTSAYMRRCGTERGDYVLYTESNIRCGLDNASIG